MTDVVSPEVKNKLRQALGGVLGGRDTLQDLMDYAGSIASDRRQLARLEKSIQEIISIINTEEGVSGNADQTNQRKSAEDL